MIKTLNGIKETVDFPINSTIRVYNNVQEDDYPLHWHTSLEIIMPVDNIYTVYCGDEVYLLKEGDIMFISPGVLHRLTSPDSGRRYIIIADLSQLDSMNEFKSLAALLYPVVHVTSDNSSKIHERLQRLINSIASEYESESLYRDTIIYSKLISIYSIIGRNYAMAKIPPQESSLKQIENSQIFLSICNYINEHFHENITLEQVAGKAGFSKFYFSRIFKQYADISFYQYLNRKRIMHAASLLMEPDITVSEVARQSGFESISAFIRMFKIQKGCTPSEFKEMQAYSRNTPCT
jgi:AraC-like DNA-binding protein